MFIIKPITEIIIIKRFVLSEKYGKKYFSNLYFSIMRKNSETVKNANKKSIKIRSLIFSVTGKKFNIFSKILSGIVKTRAGNDNIKNNIVDSEKAYKNISKSNNISVNIQKMQMKLIMLINLYFFICFQSFRIFLEFCLIVLLIPALNFCKFRM